MPRRVPTRACLFNTMLPEHLRELNGLLEEQGRTINIIYRKEFSVSGFAAPYYDEDRGEMSTRIKNDALYLWVIYEVAENCPWEQPDRAARGGIIEAIRTAPLETAMKHHPDEFVIDIAAADLAVKQEKKRSKTRGKAKTLSETKFMQGVRAAIEGVDFADPDPAAVERVGSVGKPARAKKKRRPPEGGSA